MTEQLLVRPRVEGSTATDSQTPQTTERSTFRILHLTDFHLRGKTEKHLIETIANTLVVSLKESLSFPVDFIAITGDLIHNASLFPRHNLEAILLARELLVLLGDKLAVPKERIRIAPGNHDYKWRGFVPKLKSWSRTFNDLFKPYLGPSFIPWRRTGLLFVPFDSVSQSSPGSLSKGLINLDPEDNLSIRNLIPDKFRYPVLPIALVHHHPLPVPLSELKPLGLAPWGRFRWNIDSNQSLLLLENSGRFLRYLLTNNFRLVLHGHLHQPGHWCLYSRNRMEQEVWLDIVSTGRLLQPENPTQLSFSVIEVSSDLALGGSHRISEGLPTPHLRETDIPFPPSKVTRGHTLLRAASADPTVPEIKLGTSGASLLQGQVRCKEFVQYWQIGLRTGELACVKHLRGLSAVGGSEIKELFLPTCSSDLQLSKIHAHSLTHRRDLEIRRTEKVHDDVLGSRYRIILDSPLSKKGFQDIVCRCEYAALLPRDGIDAARLGLPSPPFAEDGVSQSVIWQCERLVTYMGFDLPTEDEASEWPGPAVVLHDSNGYKTSLHPLSDHAFLDYWPIKALPKYRLPPLGKGALMLAYRLKPGSSVSLSWPIPPVIPRVRTVAVMQEVLLDPLKRGEWISTNSRNFSSLLDLCKIELLGLVQKAHPGIQQLEKQIFLVLYHLAKPADNYRFIPLESWCRQPFPADDLELPFSENLLTRAFRYCEPHYFIRSEAQALQIAQQAVLPKCMSEATYLLAVPIGDIIKSRNEFVGWNPESSVDRNAVSEATLVLLVGSTAPHSQLVHALPGGPLMDEFMAGLQVAASLAFEHS